MPRASQRGAQPPAAGRTQAEHDYGVGNRDMPPMRHEASLPTQRVIDAGFQENLSNLKTVAQQDKTQARLPQKSIDRLSDNEVTIDTAARNLAGHWDTMMGASNRPNPAWYFGHHRRLAAVAQKFGFNQNTAFDASGSMSPQNDPDSEYRAVSAMMDTHANSRQVHAVNDVYSSVTDTEAKKGVKPRLIMRKGERRNLSAMHPEDMQHVTSADNAKNVAAVDPDFDLEGYRNAGTNRQEGFRTLDSSPYNAVSEMKAAKVHLYTRAIRAAEPDTPLHHEYEMRFGDQDVARNVRLKREQPLSDIDKQRAQREGIAESSLKLHGVPDRVDIYGLMKGGTDESDPAYHHPVLGHRGLAVPDTWMNALLSGQPMEDEPGSPSPAKMIGSQTRATSSKIGPEISGYQHTLMGKTEAQASGGKEWTGNAAAGMGSLAAMQQAAVYGREAESQTNIPPVMMQEMTWVHGRLRVADSLRKIMGQPGVQKGKATMRINQLTSGGLGGEKEFRPSSDRSPLSQPSEGMSQFHQQTTTQEVAPRTRKDRAADRLAPGRQARKAEREGPKMATVTRMEIPGTFNRGYDNPLTRGEGVTRLIPATGGHAAETAGSGTRETSRGALVQPNAATPSDLDKRRAIRGAQAGYKASRADGGSAWHEEKAPRRLSEGF